MQIAPVKLTPAVAAVPDCMVLVGAPDHTAAQLAEQFQPAAPPEFRCYTQKQILDATELPCRNSGLTWALVDLSIANRDDFTNLIQCVQMLSLELRPARLLVRDAGLRSFDPMFLQRAGAHGILPEDSNAADIVAAFRKELRRNRQGLPDLPAGTWLRSLVMVARELGLEKKRGEALRRVLEICAENMHLDRATLALLDGDKLRLAAGVNHPADLEPGDELEYGPRSITAWVLENRQSRLVEGKFNPARGRGSSIRSSICAPLLHEGEVLGVVSFSSLVGGRLLNEQDVSTIDVVSELIAQHVANQRLHEDLVAKERLATVGMTLGSVSHCLKNILLILEGSSDMLGTGIRSGNKDMQLTAQNMMRKGVARMKTTVLDLLDYCREKEGEPVPVPIGIILRSVQDGFMVMNTHRRHNLEVVGMGDEADRIPWMLDEEKLQRALLNLVTNALDAMGNGGTVRISVEHREGRLLFRVEDSGPGVEPEQLNKIFVPFFSTKGSRGTGLGLAMVTKFVESAKGRISADYSPDLGGLRITMDLPAIPKERRRKSLDDTAVLVPRSAVMAKDPPER